MITLCYQVVKLQFDYHQVDILLSGRQTHTQTDKHSELWLAGGHISFPSSTELLGVGKTKSFFFFLVFY